jgi:FkbM family methyltransferase
MAKAGAGLQVGRIKSIKVGSSKVKYLAAGRSEWRFTTLLSKEPETIEWIDGFAPTETLWDIGANVGIYSIYAALRGIRVVAFEPNFANYFHLCTNIKLNNMQDRITPLCLAFSRGKSISTLNLRSMEFGESMSTFGSDLDFRGKPYYPAFRQGMIGFDIDGFVADFKVAVPNHFKVDVDGIELDIIKGGRETFRVPTVRSVQIELVDTDLSQTEGVSSILKDAGLDYVHKRHNADAAGEAFKDVLNFLYRRAEPPAA